MGWHAYKWVTDMLIRMTSFEGGAAVVKQLVNDYRQHAEGVQQRRHGARFHMRLIPTRPRRRRPTLKEGLTKFAEWYKG